MKKLLVAALTVFATQSAFANYSDVLYCTIDGDSLSNVSIALNSIDDGDPNTPDTESVKIAVVYTNESVKEFTQVMAKDTFAEKLKGNFTLVGHTEKSEFFGGSISDAALLIADKQKNGTYKTTLAADGIVYDMSCHNVVSAL